MKIYFRYMMMLILAFFSIEKSFAQEPQGQASIAQETTPHVLVSIKPLHAWVSAIMQGVATPDLLIKGSDSVHGYSLKPSDAKTLAKADIVFIVDPEMESFLTKPIASLASNAKTVSLSHAPGVVLLKPRKGGMFEPHHHHHGKEEASAHEHHHDGNHDLHFWLDPQNAIAATKYITTVLCTQDPAHAALYRANEAAYLKKLENLENEIKAKLAPHKDFNFIVFHDGYHYFENRFGVHALGSITIDPERQPGAKRIKNIHEKISRLKAVCVFSEPQFKPAIIQTVVEGTPAKSGTLDPLGVDIKAGEGAYTVLLEKISDAMIQCDTLAHKE